MPRPPPGLLHTLSRHAPTTSTLRAPVGAFSSSADTPLDTDPIPIPTPLLHTLRNQLDPTAPLLQLRHALLDRTRAKEASAAPFAPRFQHDSRGRERRRDRAARYYIYQAAVEAQEPLYDAEAGRSGDGGVFGVGGRHVQPPTTHPSPSLDPIRLEDPAHLERVGEIAVTLALRGIVEQCGNADELLGVVGRAFGDLKVAREGLVGCLEEVWEVCKRIWRTKEELEGERAAAGLLRVVNTMLARVREAKEAEAEKRVLELATMVAAMVGQPRALGAYLEAFREREWAMGMRSFDQVCWWLAQGSGDERTREQMLRVVLGPLGAAGAECHLETFLDRNLVSSDAWIELLRVTGAKDALVKEWELQRAVLPEKTTGPEKDRTYQFDEYMIGIMEPISCSTAWDMLHKSKLSLSDLPPELTWKLVKNPPAGTAWTKEMEEASLGMLEHELRRVESKLGVSWDFEEKAHERMNPDKDLDEEYGLLASDDVSIWDWAAEMSWEQELEEEIEKSHKGAST